MVQYSKRVKGVGKMPISKETAKKGGQARAAAMWAGKDPSTIRNKQMKITLSQAEFDAIAAKAKTLGVSKADLIVTALLHDIGHMVSIEHTEKGDKDD